jgi:hypothetical protein
VGECFLDAEEVEGSIPSAPTNYKEYVFMRKSRRDRLLLLPCWIKIDFDG